MNYDEIIARKSAAIAASGFLVSENELAPHLFPHQRDLTRWALRRGRSALFADTGLGKGPMALEWARHVSSRGRVLILAPLAVGPQLEREAARFGVAAKYLRVDDPGQGIVIANYEMRHAFDLTSFVGVVLDESSILKAFDGKTRNDLIRAFSDTPFKLACTATPAPNDFTELGNHSEFLGIKTRSEMLSEFFVHDGGSTQHWNIKGHAVTPFWRWVATWGAVVRLPSDLGYDDGAFRLPPLTMSEHVVHATSHDIAGTGLLFATQARSLLEQRAAKRSTIAPRALRVAELVERHDGQSVVWCDLNDEQDAISDAIADSVSIQGSTSDDAKLELLERWLSGKARTLISKASVFGFGLNFQQCNNVVFAGPSNSYERTYQAIRRCWRFGQARPVSVHIVRSELEEAVIENYRRKETDSAKMAAEMTLHVGDAVRAEVLGLTREFNPYQPATAMKIPRWL
jgi:hypothetical protein